MNRIVKLYIISALIFLVLFLSAFTFYIIPTGERGVLTTFGVASLNPITEGFHAKIPFIQRIHKMNVQTITVRFDKENTLFAASKDLQDVDISLILNYHINPLDVVSIFSQYGNNYRINVVEPIIKDIVKVISAKYTAEELVTKRADFNAEVQKVLSDKLSGKQATVETVNIVNFKFSETFSRAIEEKVTAEQNALKAKNQLEQVKFEAEQRLVESRAEAEAISIQAKAITQQGGKEYVQLQAIERWDGKLPMVTGNNIPIIDLKTIQEI